MAVNKQNKLKSYRSKMLETRQQSLDFLSGAEYQYEDRGFINGCRVINDSFSTSLEALLMSLEVTNTPVHLILGNVDTAGLTDYVGKQIKLKVVTLGVFGDHDYTIQPSILSMVDKTTYSPKLDDVIANMKDWLKPGETLLFSPAFAVMETYENYRQRAMHFDKIIGPYLDKASLLN